LTPIVVDASVAICWLMPDERHPVAAAAYARISTDPVIVPALFWFELRNVLIVNERRGRLDPALTREMLLLLNRLPITVETNINEENMMGLARTHRLTVYDAAYLEIALRRNYILATLDVALTRAARAESVNLMTPGDLA
jgi:predicted nucleic acid-binding protein